MRIHLPLHPHHFAQAGGPLAEIGGELVVIELQGELSWEGEQAGGVVGVLGLDRPDRPTLHIGSHHLLHGKIAKLPKPYAVIRRAEDPAGGALEGDAEDEESDADNEEERSPKRPAGGREILSPLAKKRRIDEDDDDEPPLFPEQNTPQRPILPLPPSSPISFHPSSAHDYSSDLASSPVVGFGILPPSEFDEDEAEEERERRREEERAAREKEERHRARRRAARPERVRHYEVVGVVRKKIVFALRPEPLVQPTPLPE
ncbi:hypothetical protein CspHIS471_0101520 [Cutaneotrichosporon sp. HIS471]|nr:hypothetical protein CspHIS471_0101520 [Cutaneotrichosporon sp. HIS471]